MMRTLLSKLAMSTTIAGAALMVSACGHSTATTNTEDTNMTDLNTMDSSEGMTNDASAMDAMGNVDNSTATGSDVGNGANAM